MYICKNVQGVLHNADETQGCYLTHHFEWKKCLIDLRPIVNPYVATNILMCVHGFKEKNGKMHKIEHIVHITINLRVR